MDETLLQFGRVTEGAPKAAPESKVKATVCPECTQRFSPDGRFCPFDGTALIAAPDWDPASDSLIGTVIDGRYEVEALVGEGGMGTVYAARHRVLGKRFALKVLRKDLARDGEIAARFLQEARTAAAVSHPGLVEITDFGTLPTRQPFFVMEFLEGQSLATLIRRGGPIPAARGVDLVRQLAEALGAAHEQAIVHRDLKPDNIHVATDGAGRDHVTIVDFGLAKVIGASRLTRAGVVFGTPHYMSPEQATGEATDHRADIYALGVVMYEMFTGRVPFEADSYMGVLTKHMYMAPTPPSQLVGTAKLGALEDILLRCLEKKPAHRYASLRELLDDVARVLEASSLAGPPPRHRRVTPRSLLADELELPSRAELTVGLERRRPLSRWPVLLIGGLFIAGVGSVLLLRLRAGTNAQPVRALAEVAKVDSSAVVVPPTVPVAPVVPLSAGREVAVVPPVPAAVPTTAQTTPPPTLGRPVASPAQKPRSPHRAPGSSAAAPASKPTSPLVRAEIVDPWAK